MSGTVYAECERAFAQNEAPNVPMHEQRKVLGAICYPATSPKHVKTFSLLHGMMGDFRYCGSRRETCSCIMLFNVLIEESLAKRSQQLATTAGS